MTNELEQIRFTTRVLSTAAAYRLEQRQVTQTLRSESDSIANAIVLGRISAGDRLDVFLDRIFVGHAKLVSMDTVTWEALGIRDARRGGFDTLDDLSEALKRAGYRFKPMNDYQFFRVRFSWLEEVYA